MSQYPAAMDDPYVLVPPRALPLTHMQATFGLPTDKLLAAIRLVLPTVQPAGGLWQLDGHRSDTIYLRKTHASPLLPRHIYQELDLVQHAGGNSVTLGVWTRLPGAQALYTELVDALTQILPRTA